MAPKPGPGLNDVYPNGFVPAKSKPHQYLYQFCSETF